MKLLCFGDSNTYGYDPRSPLGARYSSSVRWTELLAQETGYCVINAGLNGREIPSGTASLAQAAQLIRRTAPELLVIMLGTNDLLRHPTFTAEDAAARMERFCDALPSVSTLLIAPPPVKAGTWVTEERLLLQSSRLAPLYSAVAARLGLFFADAAAWNIELSFDGVHFTEAGHTAFAAGLSAVLKTFP